MLVVVSTGAAVSVSSPHVFAVNYANLMSTVYICCITYRLENVASSNTQLIACVIRGEAWLNDKLRIADSVYTGNPRN